MAFGRPNLGRILVKNGIIAMEHGVLPVRMDGHRLLVVVRDPFDIQLDDLIRQATNLPVLTGLAPESQLRELLHQYYSVGTYDGVSLGERNPNVELEVGEQE